MRSDATRGADNCYALLGLLRPLQCTSTSLMPILVGHVEHLRRPSGQIVGEAYPCALEWKVGIGTKDAAHGQLELSLLQTS